MRICASTDLVDGGSGVRFTVLVGSARVPAFAVRHDGRVVGYLNRCSHVAMELDWLPGAFFDAEARYLMCSTHGALYEPRTGHCAGGPCNGGLEAIALVERNGEVHCAQAVAVDAT